MKITSYGTWISPISSQQIAEGETSILNMLVDGDDTYWCEMRPKNHGRYTIVRRDASGNIQDVTPPDFNVRTFVHEYGGGAFTVANRIVYASNGANGAIYIFKPNSSPIQLTQGQTKIETSNGLPKWKGIRFADMRATSHGLIAIAEKHEPARDVENFLALIDTKTGECKKLADGYDFYSSPAISSDGKNIAWICWNHPEMPWTNTELWMAEIDEKGILKNPRQIAGKIPESIFQPQWKDGILYFVSDRDKGWWNIHSFSNDRIENLCPIEAEVAEPLWVFDRSTYAFLGSKIVFAYNSLGRWHLGLLDPHTKEWHTIPRPSTNIQHIRSGNNCVEFLEGYPDKPQAIIRMEDKPGYPLKELISFKGGIEEGYLSIPQHIAFPSNGRTAYGLYYAPKNKDFQGPHGEKPPLVVMIHGGPTAQTRNYLQMKMQYWTSRGFAVLDVNYGGSTGYGRSYRQLLDYHWGIIDVEDCVNGALFLANQGKVDPNKLVIRGGSAGGYTTLAALAFKNVFKSGASYYGVADITALAHDTHKFEQKYMDKLVGKYPEDKKIWEERSPIHSVDQIKSPLILFQGENDAVVPKNQSIMIYEALKRRQIPVELHIYEGEEHGFRQAKNIVHSLNRETEFYLDVFGLLSRQH